MSLADSFRCAHGKLVREGDSVIDVLRYCGQPDSKVHVGLQKLDEKIVTVVHYYYIPPKGQFLRIIEVSDGVVSTITLGSRVN